MRRVRVKRWVEDLSDGATAFGERPAAEKRRAIARLARARIDDAATLVAYHESLSFLRAFPDDPDVMRAAHAELEAFDSRVERLRDRETGELPEELLDSGIAATVYCYPFGLPMVRRLLAVAGRSLDIDRDLYDDREEDDLSAAAAPFANWIETAGLDDERLSFFEWFDRARGRRRISVLAWLVERLDASGLPEEVMEALYDRLGLTVRWDLGRGAGSRTRLRLGEPEPFFHDGPLRPRSLDLDRALAGRLPALRPTSRRRAEELIRTAVLALATRQRELFPLAHANPREVYETFVGRGIRIILFGMRPARRLPIETNYAALVLKNGVPIGYGVAAILLGEVEIAANIFPTYRRGESSFVFEQLARIFRRQFGVDRFRIERYQLGHENDEGLDAGSFWFYYKLGFRSVDPAVARLAEREAARIARAPGTRSARSMLVRLARSDMRWSPERTRRARVLEIDLGAIGARVSRRIEAQFAGDRSAAEAASLRRCLRLLSIRDWDRWTAEERRALQRWSPLVLLLPGIDRWSSQERRSLASVLRAKGSTREARYARLAAAHPRLRPALERLSRTRRG